MTAALRPKPAGSRKRARSSEAMAGWLFVLPWVIGLTVFTLIPLVMTIILGFAKLHMSGVRWVGLANYEVMISDPAFWTSAENTFVFALVSVPLKLFLALGLALLLNRQTALSGIYRAVVYLPFLVPAVAATIVFTLLLAPGAGPVNIILETFGLPAPDWLKDPSAALWTLVILSLWPLGVETMVFLGGLQAIPKDVSEAAVLDSDASRHRLFYITLPLLAPVILFNLVIGIISSFQVFTQALVIGGTTGAPAESTLLYMVVIYRTAFRYFNMGYAAALATVLFVAVLLLLLLVLRTAKSWVHTEPAQ
jgi:multiple sugar transport system permease protein